MRTLAYFGGAVASLAFSAILLIADSASFFVASSHWIAILCGGVFAFALWGTLPRPDRPWQRWGRVLPPVLVLAVALLVPFRNRESKAFYETYEQLETGMTLAEAREILQAYTPDRADEETVYYRYSPNSATVDYIRIRLEDGRIVETAYVWD